MEFLDQYDEINGVYRLSQPGLRFTEKYLEVRKRERRLYSDVIVSGLPGSGSETIHAQQWSMRKRSATRLVKYLRKRASQQRVVEIGCGNGWLSNLISKISGCQVLGVDINLPELEQAARIFASSDIWFACADCREHVLPNNYFDMVILSSVIQYFPDLSGILDALFNTLKENGEIHILDSPLYQEDRIEVAQTRTSIYYSGLQVEEMSQYYFHHSWSELDDYRYQVMYDARHLKNRITKLLRSDSPFPWIRIIKQR